jgi:outer membrane protein OmpA-like peptidoglycan-associated protein
MLKSSNLFLVLLFIFGITIHSDAQILKKLAKKAEEKIEREAEKRAERRIDKKIDEGFDEIEETIDGKNKEEKPENTDINNQDQNDSPYVPDETQETHTSTNPTVSWSRFDFVPGDTVIFEDAPSRDEENGEFPSRWDLVKGQVEIANVDGENVLMFIDGNPEIIPYLKNSSEDYLPEVFTIEFDYYRPASGNRISIFLYDRKNQRGGDGNRYIDINYNKISDQLDDVTGEHPDRDYTWNDKGIWTHISIAYTRGKLKAYMDDVRILNIPHYSGNPTGLSIQAYWADLGEGKPFYFKNIRIAKGGVKYYDRVLSEGKIIVNGIKFDINQATLRPESLGPINNIFELMQKNPSLNFSVEGHTDADGDDQYNQMLSEARAQTVKDQLIGMGIAPQRLKHKGWGESKPIDSNATPEGKANNRRVEFVKF